jgi:hypothetical protein
MMSDPFAIGVEAIGNQRIKRPSLTGAVAIDHDDLCRTGYLRASDSGVNLLSVEFATFFKHLRPTADLLPHDDATHTFHIAHDKNSHFYFPPIS